MNNFDMNNNQYNSFVKSASTFLEHFTSYKDKKIALYGIGQYTATLVPYIQGFNIIGLLDGDKENIGKEKYGLKVISIEEAEKNADMIIINTSQFYWEMIYERISDISIQVFYSNGELAHKRDSHEKILSDEEKNLSADFIKREIDRADVISFDLYDTLLMRLLCNPGDVHKLVELQLEARFKESLSFVEKRNTAIISLQKENFTLEEVYQKMQDLYPGEDVDLYKKIELQTEKVVTVLRYEMAEVFRYAAEHNKDIYILSDMYLSKAFIHDLLESNGLRIDEEHIWISGEKRKSKLSGELWVEYKDKIVQNKKALHIGDSEQADILAAKRCGINAIKIAASISMLEEIISTKLRGEIVSIYASITTGLISNELFNNPFAWNDMGEKYCIRNCFQFGKVVFGNVILTYLLWIIEKSRDLGIKKLLFLSRDGYFLRQDYLDLVSKLHIEFAPEAEYMFTSRKAILSAAAGKEKEAFCKLMEFSYLGNFKNYLYDRFDIEISENDVNKDKECQLPEDRVRVREWIRPYEDKISEGVSSHTKEYIPYIQRLMKSEGTAIVDICYTGTIQYWISKVIDKRVTGFYFVADVSEQNMYNVQNIMLPCFQKDIDTTAENSNIWKNHKIVESFFTAPYGMMKCINREGNVVTYENSNNQKHFLERELINQGCNEFATEYISLINKLNLSFEILIDPVFIDKIFGVWFTNKVCFSETIKTCFWHEDDFINTDKEYSLF